MFERALFDQIQEIWRYEQVRCNQPIKAPPSLEDLRTLIETSFFASLKKEEGRSLEFSLALISREELEATNRTHPYGPTQVIMRFREPLQLSVESITKLAGAFNKGTTALAVEGAAHGIPNEYQIWGALFFGPTTNRFNEVNYGGAGFTTFRPDCLIVTTASTGSLSIARRSHLLGHFESGVFIRSVPSPFTSDAMGNYLIAAIKKNRGWDEGNQYWHMYIRALELVLAQASSGGHGGTLILIPEKKVESSRHFQPTYSFPGDLGISFLMDEALASMKNPSYRYEAAKRSLAWRLEALSQLAAIDGALIITPEWEVLAFGAKLTAPKWTKNVVVGPDAFGGGGSIFESTKLGMRHNSAIDFVGACPAAIAFVLSEDGPIRGFVRSDDETILCWPDCRISMFV
jgi:hypothetical protein